jgi:hypothetical protein
MTKKTPPSSFMHQPPLRAERMGLFPTCESLSDAVRLAESQLPITDQNKLFSLLMTYHNTLLRQVQR